MVHYRQADIPARLRLKGRAMGIGTSNNKMASAGNAKPTPRRFPIGVQTFEQVRRDFDGYVDKTSYIHTLLQTGGKTFFLSRPRRFGKSLFLSTMEAYFEGKKELFDGLAIARLEPEWETFSVVRVDLSTVKTRDLDTLKVLLDEALRGPEMKWGASQAQTPGSRLKELIWAAHSQSGKQVVVLIDEYDAPLLNVVDEPEKLDAFRDVIREFYAPLKACDEFLRLVFITGISKFSQLSIFSELNNLRNISMLPEYAGICGITEEELTTHYARDIDTFADMMGVGRDEGLAALKENYDGYHFASESPDIYNPFSLLNALSEGRANSYWFGSGTPTSLVNLLQKTGWQIADLEGREADEDEFDAPAERMATPLPMLYQAGYLTIKGYDPITCSYTLGIPNKEVARGLSKSLVQHAAPQAPSEFNGLLRTFNRSVRAGDMDRALHAMQAFLAGIPYHLGSRDERGFETTFWLIFTLLGIQLETEFKTATGRIDAVLKAPDAIWVMEFKYDKDAQTALRQIDEKGYLVPFASDGRKLYKVGVNFSAQTRTVDEWVIEEG